jgi:hypothetical protein
MLAHYRFGLHLLFTEHKDWKSDKKQGLVVMGLYMLARNLWTQREICLIHTYLYIYILVYWFIVHSFVYLFILQH